ncbi:RNA-binding protein [Streptococcus suis]|uniref:YlmH family RNA-binding protein n=1 Tax=Streptococcus suis TaxID=1307 RepID=UPI001ABDAB8E|nr:RNA-binding protein [Streptococcus suis]
MTSARHQVYQHYNKDEWAYLDKIASLAQWVVDSYQFRLTEFVHSRQEKIIRDVANYHGLAVYSSREMLGTEYGRCIVAPEYYQLETTDFEISILELTYAEKFHQLTHAQILGTLLNRLGIKRELLGDIFVEEGRAVILVDKRFVSTIEAEVQKIAKAKVHWKELTWTDLDRVEKPKGQTKTILVSSMRLDKIVAASFNLSRQLATSLIDSGKVKVDYVSVGQASRTVQEGQLISVRSFGRVEVRNFLGYSKQGKIKLEIEFFKK